MAEREDAALTVHATKVTRRRHPKRASRLGWASVVLWLVPMIAIMGGALVQPGGGKPWWGPYLLLSWVGAVAAGIGALVSRMELSVSDATVTNREGALKVAPEKGVGAPLRSWTVPVAEVVRAAVIPGFGARLETEDGSRLDVQVPSTRDADRLVSACDLTPDKRRFETAFNASWLGAALSFVGVLAALLVGPQLAPSPKALTPMDAMAWIAGVLAFFGGTYLVSRPPKVEVGAEGLMVTTRLGSRHVPFAELSGVTLDERRLTLALHGGEELTVVAPRGNVDQMLALKHRIDMGLAAHADAPAAPARLALLDRRGRTLADWREALDQVVNDDTGYRRQPLSRDDVVAIVESPNASVERRIGAAVALQQLDGEEAGPRIRIAAEACAEGRTREALLRIADEEHEHRAVLEALEAEEVRPARAS